MLFKIHVCVKAGRLGEFIRHHLLSKSTRVDGAVNLVHGAVLETCQVRKG